jgi:hypothetical protein
MRLKDIQCPICGKIYEHEHIIEETIIESYDKEVSIIIPNKYKENKCYG